MTKHRTDGRSAHAISTDEAQRYTDTGQLDPVPTPRRRRRWFPWAFLALQVFFLIMVIVGAHSGASTHCTADCHNAHEVGTTIGTGVLIALWAFVDVILGVSYAVYRSLNRGHR